MLACFVGYIVQAVINNFVPLLFVTFNRHYGIPLGEITLLVTINFCIQLTVDFVSVKLVDRLGYRKSMVLAHIFAVVGLILLTILPEVMPPFRGILISVAFYSIGGGLLEVLVSPIVESCPADNKERTMSLLHSFYCWGYVGVVLISTAFFWLFGTDKWQILALIWTIIPLINIFMFAKTPIAPLVAEDEKGMTLKELFSSKTFWVLMIMMLCAGASEQAVSQWSSAFAEKGLGISKTLGDLAGPMTFALLMGLSRIFYGKYGDRINLDRFMLLSSVMCIASYLIISLAPYPMLSLAGSALCGISVGIMWPGTFSKASAALKTGGTAMFAMLALAGDLGCSGGPTLAGAVSALAGENMKIGTLAAIVFPVVMTVCLLPQKKGGKKV